MSGPGIIILLQNVTNTVTIWTGHSLTGICTAARHAHHWSIIMSSKFTFEMQHLHSCVSTMDQVSFHIFDKRKDSFWCSYPLGHDSLGITSWARRGSARWQVLFNLLAGCSTATEPSSWVSLGVSKTVGWAMAAQGTARHTSPMF